MQNSFLRRATLSKKALALAVGASLALGVASVAWSQATTGTIYGQIPVASGETIQITGGAGYNRTVTVGTSGKYSVTLPVGSYTVSLLQDGKVVQSRTGVTPAADGSIAVDFASSGGTQTLSTINVTATAIPAIDVTTTNQVTTITSKQLQELPLVRTAENIALLAPGVTMGAPALGTGALNAPMLVFGGASVAENAYYIDGMNTTDMLTGQGGVSLPYGAIQQQQTFTSGYGAKYGRSIGGVINQIGKSGSNEWHFGGQASWAPSSWRSNYVDQYYNNPRSTTKGQMKGDLRTYREMNTRMESIYDGYMSGPLIKDKLFFFVAAEQDNVATDVNGSKSNPVTDRVRQHYPKLYAKINWNINANNYLTLTAASNTFNNWGSSYNFDYDTRKVGDFLSLDQTSKTAFRTWVLNYTSYLTDNLTMHAMYGKSHGEYYTQQPAFPGYDPTLASIGGSASQNPAYLPTGKAITNSNTSARGTSPAHTDTVQSYRLNFDYKWRNHDFSIGTDEVQTWDMKDGQVTTGPGYSWGYARKEGADIGKQIVGVSPNSPPYVGPPNSNADGKNGYYVLKTTFHTAAGIRVSQRSQYIQDDWQVTPNLLLNIGVRNDQFINYNPAGVAYLRLTKPQWQPRLGFSWNVHGDSTLKVFGNAGRYYITLPAAAALRGAGASYFASTYYTYTGINPANGYPTGLKPLPMNPATGGVSANSEYGQPLDARSVAAQNIGAEYSDNFVLGVQQQFTFLNTKWVAGATGVFQKMGRIIDDWDDQNTICEVAVAQGYSNFAANGGCPATHTKINGATLINPGKKQVLYINDPDGKSLDRVVVTGADQRWDRGVKRNYYALNLSLSHPFDGKWFGEVIYTFSRNYGNTEGPVDSTIGQGGSSVSITQQWDFWQLMNYSSGLAFNDQRHQFKVYGAYAITPEWMVGANLFVASGHPRICLGHFGPGEDDPVAYGSSYAWCGGHPAPPGSTGFTPWTYQLGANVTYRPNWANRKLGFNLAGFNLFNRQTEQQYNPGYGTTASPSSTYDLPGAWTAPRYFRFTVSYDW